MFAAIREQLQIRDDRIQLLECALRTVVVNLRRSPEKAPAVATFARAVIRGASLQDAANEAEKAGDPTSIVEATIPATGHAATEGEG
jgi:hypothetical protein